MISRVVNLTEKYFGSEPFLLGVWIAFRRLLSKIKSMILSIVLNAPQIYLGPGSIVRGTKYISFGRNIYANRNLWLEAVTRYEDQVFSPAIMIEDHVSFSDGVHIAAIQRIVIKKNALMGSHILISDHNHGIYHGKEQSLPCEPPTKRRLGGGGAVEIGENVWIGDNVVILGPAVIGDSAVIAANSVVQGDVPSNTIVAGSPAKVIKRFNSDTKSWERM